MTHEEARQAIVQAFVQDRSLRMAYQHSISGCIHEAMHRAGGPPNLATMQECHTLADTILLRILGGPSTGGKV